MSLQNSRQSIFLKPKTLHFLRI